MDTQKALPLAGRRIVVTRAKEQSGGLLEHLREIGADALEFPVIKTVPPETWDEIDGVIAELSTYNWVVFTSVNGVEYFWQRMIASGKDSQSFSGVKSAAVGSATADSLRSKGVEADLIPTRFVAEAILDTLGENLQGQRFMLPRADIARQVLVTGLEERGAIVTQITAYRTVVGGESGISPSDLLQLLEQGQVDVVTFTSASTVRNFATRLSSVSTKTLPELLKDSAVACIGPITASAALEMGLKIDLQPGKYTIDELVVCISDYFNRASATV
ncbi:MAG: uroporphyrinogen-III synthase [Chloroflexi bacterium]|uniref:Uroporphyrinogen-III synthase n=1 Tax=Candidatus Chlorohelix allophototropha TaxID=3003348 RepID=A0A8T7M339_9CHLR|nr:uroporphyrinogen-III synthase [Chloroflexota bacterium]WJW67160.1 uroporphyrinogen-III synthase [Chloroflexota bacterium L227-S17]